MSTPVIGQSRFVPQNSGEGLFVSQIRPILAARCYQCHGSDLQQNGLRLDSLEGVLKGSANGAVVVPGSADKSPLVRRIMSLDRPKMPFGGPPLTDGQISLIRKWIDAGAQGPDSAEPIAAGKPVEHCPPHVKPVRPDVPTKSKMPPWCRKPDRQLCSCPALPGKGGLEAYRPEASQGDADPARIRLTSIGIPPSRPEEVDAFLADLQHEGL